MSEKEKIDEGGNAFPRVAPTGYIQANDADAEFWERQRQGMTLRQYYAGMALQGLIARGLNPLNPNDAKLIPATCFKMADEMIKESKGG